MALPIVYLTASGYSGGGVHLIANTNVLFDYDTFGPPVQYGIEINTGTTDITFEASNTLTSSDTMDISFVFLAITETGAIIRNFTNYATCSDFSSKNNYFAINQGTILTLKQYGTFSTFTSPAQALFSNVGSIGSLYNSSNFYIASRLPQNYFINIQDLSTYGKLTMKEPDAGNMVFMNFGIDPSGSIVNGTYASVLSNISIYSIVDTSGVYLGHPWSLVVNGDNIDLVVETNIVFLTSTGYSGGGNDVRAVSDIVFDYSSAQAIYTLTGTTDLSFYPGYTISALGDMQYFLINNATIGHFNNQAVLTNNFMYFALNIGTIGDLYDYGQMRGKYNPPVDGANFWNMGTITNLYNSDNFFIQDNLPTNYYARIVSDVSYGTLTHIPSTSNNSMNFYIESNSSLQDGQTYVGVLQNIQSSEFSPQSGTFDGLFDWTLVNNGFDTWDLVVTAVSNIVYLRPPGYSGGGNDVIADIDVMFNVMNAAAIFTNTGNTTFNFQAGLTITAPFQNQLFFYNTAIIDLFQNYSLLEQTSDVNPYFATNEGTIQDFYNYGQIRDYLGSMSYAVILNDGVIQNLYNSDHFAIETNLPRYYYIRINSTADYGILSKNGITISANQLNFNIAPGSTLQRGYTYYSVLQHVQASDLVDTSGNSGSYDWTLVYNDIADAWNLVIPRITVYLEPTGYSGGRDDVVAYKDVIFNTDLTNAINNIAGLTSFNFPAEYTITAPTEVLYFFYNSATITDFSNNGTLIKDHPTVPYFALNDVEGVIQNFYNYGRIYNSLFSLGSYIINNGTITRLFNADRFLISGRLPEIYFVSILSDVNYGTLINDPSTPNTGPAMSFFINPSSTLIGGATYYGILQNISASSFIYTSGNFNGLDWVLENNGSDTWSLVVSNTVYLRPPGYIGGGNLVIADIDVVFEIENAAAIYTNTGSTSISFQPGVTITAPFHDQLFFYNTAEIETIRNDGILLQTDPSNSYFATNEGTILGFFSYGAIRVAPSLFELANIFNPGVIVNLYNLDEFKIRGNLPTNYFIRINSVSEYGILEHEYISSNNMNFDIDPESVLELGQTYTGVLRGFQTSLLNNTSGTFSGLYNWTLVNDGFDTWSLVVAGGIVYLRPPGYSGGGDQVIADIDVVFEIENAAAIYTNTGSTNFNFQGGLTITAPFQNQLFFYNTAAIELIQNYSLLQQTDPTNQYFSINVGTILDFYNYGQIVSLAGAPFLNAGEISNLYNVSPFLLDLNLPLIYYATISSPSVYGTLIHTGSSGNIMNFFIDPPSSLMAGHTYQGVLQGVPADSLVNTSGTFPDADGLQWVLINNQPDVWDLVVGRSPVYLVSSGYQGGGDLVIANTDVSFNENLSNGIWTVFAHTTVVINDGVTVTASWPQQAILYNTSLIDSFENNGILEQTDPDNVYFALNSAAGVITNFYNSGQINSAEPFQNDGVITHLYNASALFLTEQLPLNYYVRISDETTYGTLLTLATAYPRPMNFLIDPSSNLSAGAVYTDVLQNIPQPDIRNNAGIFYSVGAEPFQWALVCDSPSAPNQWVLAVQNVVGTPVLLDASGYIGGGADVLVMNDLIMMPPIMPYALINVFDQTSLTITLGVTVDSSGALLLNEATLENFENLGTLRQTSAETAVPYFMINDGTITNLINRGTISNTVAGNRAVLNNTGMVINLYNYSNFYIANKLPFFYYAGVRNNTSYGKLIYTAGTPLQQMFFGIDPNSILVAGARYSRVLQNVSAGSIATFSGTFGTKKWTLVNSVAVQPAFIRAHAVDPTSWDLLVDSTPVPPTPTPSTTECLYVCPPKVLAKKNGQFNGNTNDSTRTNAFAYAQLVRRRNSSAGQPQVLSSSVNAFGYYAGAPRGSGAPPRNRF